MNKLKIGILLFGLTIIFSCKKEEVKPTIKGLWLVTKVKMGEDEMTPIARWMRFNADSTQTSGNGWLQHSEGSWSVNKNNQLTVTNTNGLLDAAEPFAVKFEGEKMIWSRTEEGQDVQVFLERIKQIPSSEGNRLMGLWKIESIAIDNEDFTTTLNPDNNATFFLRWDNVYVFENYPQGKIYGVYKVHGHKPEIQMVNYGDNPQFQFYTFSISDLELKLTSTDKKTELKLKRIYQFL